MSKPNLQQIIKREQEYRLQIEKSEADLRLLNQKAQSLNQPGYEIAQRSHLAVYIDETKLAYKEATGIDYDVIRRQGGSNEAR